MQLNITIILVGVSFFSCFNKKRNIETKIKESKIEINDTTSSKKTGTLDSFSLLGFTKINMDSFGFVNDMRYATNNNLLKQKIYACAECYLRNEAAKSLINAQNLAKKKGFRLVIFDCYRPLPLQQKMYDLVKDKRYVADPKKGSKHNKGVAIDVSLANKKGELLDMGTDFDDFTEESHYANSAFNSKARETRKILREIMYDSNFEPYNEEWWHFNFKNTNFSNESIIWNCP